MTNGRIKQGGMIMFEWMLGAMLIGTEPRQIPGPYRIPGNVKTPVRVLRCQGFDCNYWWPTRVGY